MTVAESVWGRLIDTGKIGAEESSGSRMKWRWQRGKVKCEACFQKSQEWSYGSKGCFSSEYRALFLFFRWIWLLHKRIIPFISFSFIPAIDFRETLYLHMGPQMQWFAGLVFSLTQQPVSKLCQGLTLVPLSVFGALFAALWMSGSSPPSQPPSCGHYQGELCVLGQREIHHCSGLCIFCLLCL